MINSVITYGATRITLNDLSNLHSFYAFDIVRPDTVVVRQTKDYIPGQNEADFFRANLGERLIELRGTVRGYNETDLYTKIEDLKEAFHPIGVETDTSGTDGFLPLKWTDLGRAAKMYLAKPLRVVDVSESVDMGFERNFRIFLETEIPFALSQASKNYTLSIVTGTGTGGGAIPATVPMLVAGGSVYAGTQVVVNSGDIPANLTATFNNQNTAPKVTNSTTGETVAFTSDVSLNDGDQLVVDFKNSTAWLTASGVATNVIKYLTTASRFFKINSGNNTLIFTGDSLSATANCEVSFYDTYS